MTFTKHAQGMSPVAPDKAKSSPRGRMKSDDSSRGSLWSREVPDPGVTLFDSELGADPDTEGAEGECEGGEGRDGGAGEVECGAHTPLRSGSGKGGAVERIKVSPIRFDPEEEAMTPTGL